LEKKKKQSQKKSWGSPEVLSHIGTMVELGEVGEVELQHLVAVKQQKVQFTAQVHHFLELCWDKCVEKPGTLVLIIVSLALWTTLLTLLLPSPVGLPKLCKVTNVRGNKMAECP
jgi:hypothetical protein